MLRPASLALSACALAMMALSGCEDKKTPEQASPARTGPTSAPNAPATGGSPPVIAKAGLADADVIGTWAFDAAAALDVAKDAVKTEAEREHRTLADAEVQKRAEAMVSTAGAVAMSLRFESDGLCSLVTGSDTEGGKWIINAPTLDVAIARFGQMRFSVSGGVMRLLAEEAAGRPPLAFKKR